MIPESHELVIPVRVDVIQPPPQDRERLRAQLIHPHPGVVFDVGAFDKSSLSKHPQMAARRWATHPERSGNLAGPKGTIAQQVDDLSARWFRQGGEGAIDIGNHMRT